MIIENWSLPDVLYTQYLGVVSGEQLISYALGASGDERFENIKYVIGDWSQVERTEISTEHVRELMACLKVMARLCPDARNASIVKRNESGLSLAAWYKHLADGLSWDVRIFHDPRECFSEFGLDFHKLKVEQGCVIKKVSAL
ncbi:hypothetical protein [Agaribacterium haliotis]|uniref:hypothetical protein n=1 Tax=Agaribacterium haliotis TaxID=2013869 RepID=UPI000BB58A22|nr:hypothetical protein [Agaribacterium haliotis]